MADPPNWDDNPGNYEFTSTISGGIVLSQGKHLNSNDDLFAAFDVDGNVRGLAIQLGIDDANEDGIPDGVPFGPYEGQIIYEMQMRSNSMGDLLTFKYYDASDDAILDIVENYIFVINDVIGNVLDPVFYHINYCPIGTTFMEHFLEGTPDNICVPDDFSTVNQSSEQTFYNIISVTINGEAIESDDWVGVFNGDICVGAKLWDTSVCASDICTVPAFGEDPYGFTEGYLEENDIPTFKIFDISENKYYYAQANEEVDPFINMSIYTILNLNGLLCVDNDNLVSPLGCSAAAEALGCEGLWGGVQLKEICMETCGNCDIYGCTDSEACNYNPDANMDDGTCLGNDCSGECGGSAEVDECGICNGECNGPDGQECGNYDCDGNCVVGADCLGVCGGAAVVDACGNCGGDENNADECNPIGCTDSTACNFNPLAVIDDGSCVQAQERYDCNGNCKDIVDCFGNCSGDAIVDVCGNCSGGIENIAECAGAGCTEILACNYNEIAVFDDDSCILPTAHYDCDGNCVVGADCLGVCGGTAVVDACGNCGGTENNADGCNSIGCTDSTACNFNALAVNEL